ncbi:MAG: AEC family transporter [Lachnospiraceae bacterium]|nr:AEC family transporter [Lachnospiraceae bacterium]
MNNLIYSLNATMPVFAVIVVGYLLKRKKFINEEFISVANRLNFKITLPLLLIKDLMAMDFRAEFNVKFVAYCAIVTIICFFSVWIGAKLFVRDKSVIAEFVQGSFRSSAAILGTAFMINIYGDTGMVPMMIIGAVPLYNIFSVIVLQLESPMHKANTNKKMVKQIRSDNIKKSIKGIATNPILIGIFIGVALSLAEVDFPVMVDNTVGSLAKLTTPLALLAIGGSFEFGKAIEKIRPAVTGAFIKLAGQAVIFLPIAVLLGFRNKELMAIVIMLGSPTTPSCYIMAKGAGCDGILTSSMVVLTTLFSAVTITTMIFILRTLGYV